MTQRYPLVIKNGKVEQLQTGDSLYGLLLLDQTVGQTVGSTGSRLTKLWATDIAVTDLEAAATITAGTTITATLGDIIATDGNFKVGTGGHGIDFSPSGNLAGATSELLDDYEIGTFTPALTSSGGGTFSTNVNSGTYVKIGGLVVVNLFINCTSIASAGAGHVTITGLPFTAGQYTAIAYAPANHAAGAVAMMTGYMASGSTVITFFKYSAGTVTYFDVAEMTNSSQFILSVTYRI